jgi:Family of unknown function (DUF5670)
VKRKDSSLFRLKICLGIEGKNKMLEVLMLVLFALWLIGMLIGQQFDGFIHLLLIGIASAFGIRYFTVKKSVD